MAKREYVKTYKPACRYKKGLGEITSTNLLNYIS